MNWSNKMNIAVSHISKLLTKVGDLFSSFWGWLVFVVCQLFMIEGFRAGFVGLGVLFLLDFMSGIGASWVESKKEVLTSNAPYFIESKKIRGTLIKAVAYSLFIGMSYLMYVTFFNGTTGLPMSDKEFNIISICFGLCIAIECWSIIENVKRMGYDLIGALVKVFKGFWNTYEQIKRD